jgi:hypothetical protein
MESTIEPSATSYAGDETYQILLARARRKTGAVPPELLVRHILAVTAEGDWPVRREALEALLRRVAFGKADGLQIVSRPGGSRLLGLYATRRKGSSARPYRTRLRRVDPIVGHCDCADFLRSSLGLCKHLLAVLEDVTAKPRAFEKAKREPVPSESPLRWDPVRPLTGPGDWLARVRWVDGTPRAGLRRWLRPAKGGGWTLALPASPGRRIELVDALLGALGDGRGEPALHALLQEDRRRIAHASQGARDLDRLRKALGTLKQRLYPYQREAVERFLSRGRLLLADDMGLGKTAQAIAACPRAPRCWPRCSRAWPSCSRPSRRGRRRNPGSIRRPLGGLLGGSTADDDVMHRPEAGLAERRGRDTRRDSRRERPRGVA